ncbi:MAG: TrkA family potassium uptake protein [Dehalococcoidia bacterium]|nr:MAG: TrkA family potassium uptake protein [Dehalococcoidia bacterium]
MYIIIIGGGRLGYYLARALLDEGHEVLIIEKNASFCEIINEEMGSVCVRGDGCEAATLADVGTGRADMLVAATGDDEDNLVACQVAKYKFNVPRTIARIRNPQNEAIFKKLGVDVTVSATTIILEAIEKEVPTHPLTHLLTLSDKGLEIVEVRIPSNSAIIGKLVKEIPLPEGSKLALVIPRDRKPRIPTTSTVIREGDQVIALTTPELEAELRTVLTGI